MTSTFDIELLFKLVLATALVGLAMFWVGTNLFPTEFAQFQAFFDQNGIDVGFDYDSFAHKTDKSIYEHKNDAAVWMEKNSR